MSNELFPIYVFWWAVGVIALMLGWIFVIHCWDQMKGAWDEMKGREWRWPEGTNGVYAPGDEPYRRSKQ
jgi:hypothetical protein